MNFVDSHLLSDLVHSFLLFELFLFFLLKFFLLFIRDYLKEFVIFRTEILIYLFLFPFFPCLFLRWDFRFIRWLWRSCFFSLIDLIFNLFVHVPQLFFGGVHAEIQVLLCVFLTFDWFLWMVHLSWSFYFWAPDNWSFNSFEAISLNYIVILVEILEI